MEDSAVAGGELVYLHGFGNEHQSEALPGALPVGQFSPQKPPYGLYPEQFSTTAFTAPRATNRRTWFYRIRPSVVRGDLRLASAVAANVRTAPITEARPLPMPMRWDPLPAPTNPVDFVDGLITFAANGDAGAQVGLAIHLYTANRSMGERVFCCADGELLIVPQRGALDIRTECGRLRAAPGEIAVVPRGMLFHVGIADALANGYVCENYGAAFELPERGPVGANGFANDRDFLCPVAAFEERSIAYELVTKFGGAFFTTTLEHSPFDVVAWTGNSAPYKYDLARFNVIGSVSFDHPDPSIFTVLTSASTTPGVANVDFVIFPPRWMVAEHTFRPPWYHRNVMSEFMGLIRGVYDAKPTGFVPGGASLHNSMTPHGPEAGVLERASTVELAPERYQDTLAFMLESRYPYTPTRYALESPTLQGDYTQSWRGIESRFQHR
jgi:homogentisate 1,2-dioxygenase